MHSVKGAAGSVEEFRRFYKSTAPRFMKAAYVLLGDRSSAEDAMQVALLRTYRHWERTIDPGGYTWRVLVNVCRNECRRRSRMPETEPPGENEPPSREVLDAAVAARRDLLSALHQLPYNQREAVVLRYYLDLSVSETAQVLGVPEGTVKSMSARALSHLRRVLSSSDRRELPTAYLEVHDVE
jgi:RNA polymerase sigma-70 factor (sigma-E family)